MECGGGNGGYGGIGGVVEVGEWVGGIFRRWGDGVESRIFSKIFFQIVLMFKSRSCDGGYRRTVGVE